MNSNITSFLLGMIAAASGVAAMFFYKFWKSTRDSFFLAFSAFFLIEAINRTAMVLLSKPSEGSPWIYGARLVGSLVILLAILRKNYGRS